MSDEGRACRCGAPMVKEGSEAGMDSSPMAYRYGYPLDPWAVEYWRCDVRAAYIYADLVIAEERRRGGLPPEEETECVENEVES